MSAVTMVKGEGKNIRVDERRWTDSRLRLLKLAASYPEVERTRQSGDQEEAVRYRDGRPHMVAQGAPLLGTRLSFPHSHRLPARLDGLQGAVGAVGRRRLRRTSGVVVHR
jgi:hypothetical protein